MSLFPVFGEDKKDENEEGSLFPVSSSSKEKQKSTNYSSSMKDDSKSSLFPLSSGKNKSESQDALGWLVNTSFQAEPEKEQAEDEESSKSSSDEEDQQDKKKRKKKDKKEKKRKKRKSEKEKIIELEKKVAKEDERKSSDIWITNEKEYKVFFFDRVGDQNNIFFGSIYKHDVPTYRKPKGVCLGLPASEGITVNKKGMYEVFKRRSKDASQSLRYTNTRFTHLENDLEFKRLTLTHPESKEKWVSEDFVVVERDEAKEEEEELQGESLDDFLTKKTREFNQQTREHPENIDLWLKFIEFQDEFFKLGKKQTKGLIIEKKISIYERALEDNPRSEVLKLGLLKDAQQLWDSEKVQNLWKKTLSEHKKSGRVWKAYIEYHQNNFNTFTVSETREVFGDAIQALQSQVMDRLMGSTGSEIRLLELDLLDLIIRFCVFEKESGHVEKSIGYFQALIEFNCFSPPALVDHQDLVRNFEEFWNTEHPRVGDEGAAGWSSWYKNPSQDPPKPSSAHRASKAEIQGPSRPQVAGQFEKEKKVYQSWFMEEEKREHQLWQPCRPSVGFGVEEGEELDDPERVVLFEDVQNLLFKFTCDDVRMELAFRFIEFLGHVMPHRQSTSDPYHVQKLSFIEEVEDIISLITSNSLGSTWEKHKKIKDESVVRFIRVIFLQLSKAFPKNNDVLLAYMHFESLYSIDAARRWAKTLLKENQMDLNLWNGYAQMELNNGKVEEARKVYGTALSLSSSLPAQYQVASPVLFRYFAELELSKNSEKSALHVLTSVAEGSYNPKVPEKVEPTRIVKARKIYQQKFTEVKATIFSVHFIQCYALFEYLTLGLDAACEIYKKSLNTFEEETPLHEEILLCFSKLVYKHSLTSPTPPGRLRNILLNALDIYPNNFVFLNLFVENESRSQMANRIRTFFSEALSRHPSLVLWLFAIHVETAKLGAIPRVKSLFEKALETSESRTSVLLWRYYLQFDLQKISPDSAKSVYYRGIRNCPWSKPLWLDSIRLLLPTMNLEELNDLLKLLNEKEIRVRQMPDLE